MRVDPTGLAPPGLEGITQRRCAREAFSRNYDDMRAANWKLSDKYFHCKANCEAARCGKYGYDHACAIGDFREMVDQTFKGDPPSASAADQAANQYGRDTANKNPTSTCQVICARYRPNGLPAQY